MIFSEDEAEFKGQSLSDLEVFLKTSMEGHAKALHKSDWVEAKRLEECTQSITEALREIPQRQFWANQARSYQEALREHHGGATRDPPGDAVAPAVAPAPSSAVAPVSSSTVPPAVAPAPASPPPPPPLRRCDSCWSDGYVGNQVCLNCGEDRKDMGPRSKRLKATTGRHWSSRSSARKRDDAWESGLAWDSGCDWNYWKSEDMQNQR